VDGAVLACRLAGTGNRFGSADCFFVKLPLVDGFPASFACEIGIQRSLGFIERIFRIGPRAAGSLVRFLDFAHERLNFRIGGRRCRFALTAAFARQRFVSCFNFIPPARFRGPILFIQSGIGLVRDLSHFAFLKEPGEDRPVHRFGHQRLGVLNFGKLSHSPKTITSHQAKVQGADDND